MFGKNALISHIYIHNIKDVEHLSFAFEISEDVTSVLFVVSNPFNASFLVTESVSTVLMGQGMLEPSKERGLGGGQASIKARI